MTTTLLPDTCLTRPGALTGDPVGLDPVQPGSRGWSPAHPAAATDSADAGPGGGIIAAAWEADEEWGTLVWLAMVTRLRRAELLGLRWSDVDLTTGTLTVARNVVVVAGQLIEKDTKTHRMRRIALDPATVEVLTEQRERWFGIDSHLHALRHYSATELLMAGVDLRTVAGGLGHGTTTLRVYAAWVGESDRRAAEILGVRVTRPARSPA